MQPSPEPTPDDRTTRLERLARAMDAFLQFRGTADDHTAAGAREEFLRRHAELRDLLEPMFAADGDGDGPADAPPSLRAGQTLGDYRLQREVGRGGMGIVFEAEQISLRRRVALKVLSNQQTLSARAIERFRHEAAAASRLRHPAIVPIFEVGEARGVHFFSMEFVDGRPLNEVMQNERLGVRADCSRAAEAAELCARLADALQHAHDHGLVHRDVKPHNVMLGHDGSVRLLDFGLVKELEPRSRSATVDFLGTPHYASPEQVTGTGQVGPASDVFSLGIVLYELLARRRPFDGDTARVVMRRIEHGEFPSLRTAAPSAPRDLQTVCHKALERRPQDRYASAGEFAADLRRFLRIEPIRAAAPGLVTRTAKWVRRHHLRVIAGTAIAAAGIGAPLAYALHQQATNRAIRRERAVLAEAEQLGFQSIEQTLALLADQLDRLPGSVRRHEPRADAVVQLCDRFLALRVDEPARRDRVASALIGAAAIYANLGRLTDAFAACRRARELLDASGEPTAPAHRTLVGRLLQRELLVRQLADPNSGDAEFARAEAHWRDLGPDAATQAVSRRELAGVLLLRASVLADRADRRAEAKQLAQRVLDLLPPGDPEAAALRVRAEAALGRIDLAEDRYGDAQTRLRKVVASIDALPAEPVLAVEKALAMATLGSALQHLGRAADAEAALQEAIQVTATNLRLFPGSRALQRAMLLASTELALRRMVDDRLDLAEATLRAATALPTDEDVAPNTQAERMLLAEVDRQLANCLLLRDDRDGSHAEAERLLQRACARLVQLVEEQPDHRVFRIELAMTWNALASSANEHGRYADAIHHAERAVAQQQVVLAATPDDPMARTMLGLHQGLLAHALARVDRGTDAVAAAAAAIANAPNKVATLRMAAEAAARAAGSAAGNDALTYGGVAVQALQAIAELDHGEARRLLADRRFRGLGGREDFQTLQRRLAP
ncbi:MAG: protein kinase [Planctomycetes bacterium]|nr:protein kinase [Planctomycetota bacterium]